MRLCYGGLAKAQATARVDVPTAPLQCGVLFFWKSLMSGPFLVTVWDPGFLTQPVVRISLAMS